MMELNKLRKADIFSGAAILLLGFFIVIQALKMPMKDSYGGVQNVWYVSPALFPLFIGGILIVLGFFLVKTALKTVGFAGFNNVLFFLRSTEFLNFLKQEASVRFYSIVFNLLVFVFILIPHIDFFLASTLFLLVFFFMFYCGDHHYLLYVFHLTITESIILSIFLFSPLLTTFNSLLPYSADWLTIILTGTLIYFSKKKQVFSPILKKRFKLSLLIGFVAPLTIGISFKYFLLVPMPYEGLIVQILDAVWYADFWS